MYEYELVYMAWPKEQTDKPFAKQVGALNAVAKHGWRVVGMSNSSNRPYDEMVFLLEREKEEEDGPIPI